MELPAWRFPRLYHGRRRPGATVRIVRIVHAHAAIQPRQRLSGGISADGSLDIEEAADALERFGGGQYEIASLSASLSKPAAGAIFAQAGYYSDAISNS